MTIVIEGIKTWREGIGWAQFSEITVSDNYDRDTREKFTQGDRDALMMQIPGSGPYDIRFFECESRTNGDRLILERKKDWLKRFSFNAEYADKNAGGTGKYLVLVRYGWDK